jgi:hypothetical protein
MRWLPLAVIALGLAAAWQIPQVVAQEPLTWKRDNKGDAIAIQVSADDAITWPEGGKRVFLLRGKVWIEQGGDSIRVPEAVLWIDEEGKRTTGIYRLSVYGEGGVALEVAAHTHQAPTGLFELNTRGEVQLKTYKSKVVQKSGPDPADVLYQHALAAFKTPAAAAAATIQQASFQQPATPAPPAPAQTPQVFQPPTVPVPPAPGTGGSPVPVVPPPGPGALPAAPKAPDATPPPGPPGSISIVPKSTSVPFKWKDYSMDNGEKATVFSGGIIVHVERPQPLPKETIILEVEADRAVVWTQGDLHDLLEGSQQSSTDSHRNLEFYLSGNVQIRTWLNRETKVIRCNEAYYDVNRSAAIVLDADLEVTEPLMTVPLHVIAPEIHQLDAEKFWGRRAMVNGSKLPYGPGLDLWTSEFQLEDKKVLRKSIFGAQFYDPKTGQPEYETQRILTAWNVFPELEGIPFFYLPYLQGDVNDPLGPLQSLSIGYSRIFGFQFFSSFNVFDLLGIDPPPGQRLRLNLDYLSARGPDAGIDYGAIGKDLFGIPSRYEANVASMYIHDTGVDILGGGRGQTIVFGLPPPPFVVPISHPDDRGRFNGNLNWQDLPSGFTVKAQVGYTSDRNFLDQYYNQEWVNGLDQETYIYVQQRQNNLAWDLLASQRITQEWLTRSEALPAARGYWLGQDFLDLFSNNLKGGAGYYHLQPTTQPPFGTETTDVNVATGRFDVWDELSLPFEAGAFKLVPYAVIEGAYYTKGITGDDLGRLYYGGGIRGSIPFSKLYPDVNSELFNVNGIYHKIVLSGDYFYAQSTRSFRTLPQIDRLNDDESDQALRDIAPQQFQLNPANAMMLNSGFFDPQLFALRKLVLDRIDTLDSIDEFTLDLRQRWQTKRGFPGQEHIIDWMTLDLSASFFPQPSQNFGESVNFLAYDWSWSIGDRTTLFSSGWFDPHPGAARTWNVGAELNRPDRSSLYIGYREIDPLASKMVIASVSIPFSSKYLVTAATSYDFGVNTQINTLMITRTGSDLMVSLGLTYNSIVNNFGFAFEIYPNLLPPPHVGPLALAR